MPSIRMGLAVYQYKRGVGVTRQGLIYIRPLYSVGPKTMTSDLANGGHRKTLVIGGVFRKRALLMFRHMRNELASQALHFLSNFQHFILYYRTDLRLGKSITTPHKTQDARQYCYRDQ